MEPKSVDNLLPTTDRFCPIGETLHHAGDPSKSTLYHWIDKGEFPAPYQISAGRVAWSFNEIQHWIATKKQAAALLPKKRPASQ